MEDSQNSRRFAFRFEQPFFRKDTYEKPMHGVSNVRSLHIRNCRSAYKDNPEKTDLGGGYQQFACFQPNRWVQHASAISPLEVQKSPPRRGGIKCSDVTTSQNTDNSRQLSQNRTDKQ
jgi:hypothetical protein